MKTDAEKWFKEDGEKVLKEVGIKRGAQSVKAQGSAFSLPGAHECCYVKAGSTNNEKKSKDFK